MRIAVFGTRRASLLSSVYKRCCATDVSAQPELPWNGQLERRMHRAQLPGRDHRRNDAERRTGGTALGHQVRTELRSATTHISSLGRQRKWEEALAVFAAVVEPDAVVRSAAVDACARSMQMDVALRLFQEMPKKNMGAYTSLINMFGRMRRVGEAEDLMREMQQESIEPDGFVYSSIVMAYGAMGDVDSAMRIFRQRQQVAPATKVLFGAMMSVCGRNGEVEQARQLLAELEAANMQPDVEHMTSLITACCRRRDEAGAYEVVAEIRKRGLKMDLVAYTTLMGTLSGQDGVARADAMFQEMEQEGIKADAFVFDAMLDVCIRVMDTDRFQSLLTEMEQRGLAKTRMTERKISVMQERQQRESYSMPAADARPAVPAAPSSLPAGWHATQDPSTRNYYYWNEKDPASTTTWVRPSV